jgi:hypothetical protein
LSIRNFIVEISVVAAKTERRTGKREQRTGSPEARRLFNPRTHHDALKFPSGKKVLLIHLLEGSGSNNAPASGATCYSDENQSSRTGPTVWLICNRCSGRLPAGGGFLIFPGRLD